MSVDMETNGGGAENEPEVVEDAAKYVYHSQHALGKRKKVFK